MNKIALKLFIFSSVFLLFILISNAKVQAITYDKDTQPYLSWSKTVGFYSVWFSEINDNEVDGSALYTVGREETASDESFYMDKRDLDTGKLVSTFGTSGVVTRNPGPAGSSHTYYDIDIFDGKLYLCGRLHDEVEDDTEWYGEKTNPATGALEMSFSSDPSSYNDFAYSIAAYNSSIYVGGLEGVTASDWQCRIEKRDSSSGNLITSFGTNGVVTENVNALYEVVLRVAADSTGLYSAGYNYLEGGNAQWVIEKRDLSTGDLINSFGTNGVINSNPTTGNDEVRDMIIDGSYLYIIGTRAEDGDHSSWRIEKRNKSDGSLVNDFGSSGVVSYYDGGNDYPRRIVSDETGVYIIGYTTNQRALLQKRDKTSGDLIWSKSQDDHYYHALSVDNSGVYLGAEYDNSSYEFRTEKFSFKSYPYFVNIPGTSSVINLTEGQTVTVNPFIIKVKPESESGIVKVEFFIDDVLVCSVTSPDVNGVYSCSWDTSKYQSDVRIVAYNQHGYSAQLTRSAMVSLAETGQFILPYISFAFLLIAASVVIGSKVRGYIIDITI